MKRLRIKMDAKKAKIKGQEIDSTVRIGKKGIDENMVDEIERQLEDKELIKIKVLRNNPIQDIDEIVEILEENIRGKAVEVRGKTILLAANELLEK